MAENPQVPEVNAPTRPQQHEKYPWPAEPTLVGKRIQRLDGPSKVTGQASPGTTSIVLAACMDAFSVPRTRTRASWPSI